MLARRNGVNFVIAHLTFFVFKPFYFLPLLKMGGLHCHTYRRHGTEPKLASSYVICNYSGDKKCNQKGDGMDLVERFNKFIFGVKTTEEEKMLSSLMYRASDKVHSLAKDLDNKDPYWAEEYKKFLADCSEVGTDEARKILELGVNIYAKVNSALSSNNQRNPIIEGTSFPRDLFFSDSYGKAIGLAMETVAEMPGGAKTISLLIDNELRTIDEDSPGFHQKNAWRKKALEPQAGKGIELLMKIGAFEEAKNSLKKMVRDHDITGGLSLITEIDHPLVLRVINEQVILRSVGVDSTEAAALESLLSIHDKVLSKELKNIDISPVCNEIMNLCNKMLSGDHILSQTKYWYDGISASDEEPPSPKTDEDIDKVAGLLERADIALNDITLGNANFSYSKSFEDLMLLCDESARGNTYDIG